MLHLKIDGIEVEISSGYTVLQACEQAGKEIPRFCYHDRLSIAGNCRMCLVQISNNTVKPIASCALPAADNMEVFTDTPMIQEARAAMLEFLLINHPLDCPICDQGGECDLQDITMRYGAIKSRFFEQKRSVVEKYMGPLIKTEMNRCIHCTRCIRFASEIAGVDIIGMINRGEHAEITTLENSINSELSANVIDLCPVGALTSRPYAFEARPWELQKTETIDVMDALGSNIRIDSRGNSVLRIMPLLNEEINEEWISDKTRYACDGLRIQRLDRPYVKQSNRLLQESSWNEALSLTANKLLSFHPSEIACIVGDLVDVESIYACKKLMESLQISNLESRQDGSFFDSNNRSSYLFNATVAGIDESDVLLIVGSNPRLESPVLNARIRKRWLKGDLNIGLIGEKVDLTYDYNHLNSSPTYLKKIKDTDFGHMIKNAKKPLVLIGPGVMQRSDCFAIQKDILKLGIIRDKWNGYCQMHTAASRVGALDLGFVPKEHGKSMNEILSDVQSGKIKCIYLFGADECNMDLLKNAFIIYQGHHGDHGASIADIILPGAAYTEKDGTFVNLEGRVQRSYAAVSPPGLAQIDWKIFRSLSELLNKDLSFNSLEELRIALYKEYPHFSQIGYIEQAFWNKSGPDDGAIEDFPFVYPISCFYRTCSISRSSPTMSHCVREILKHDQEVTL